MSLSSLQINPLLLKELYNNVLVNIGEKVAQEKEENGDIKFLGNNEKNIMVIVNEPDAPFIKDEELQFLSSILSACKLSLGDTAIINTAARKISYNEITDSFAPKVILFFGINLRDVDMPMLFPVFQLQQYNNQKMVLSPSLTQLSVDVEAKKRLWTILKQIFPG